MLYESYHCYMKVTNVITNFKSWSVILIVLMMMINS
jgi:hypothetical protein